MGGEGAMMQANQSLKANRKLVGKRKENRFSFVHTSTEKTEYNLPKATKEDIRLLREKLLNESRRDQIKLYSIVAVFVIISVIGLSYVIG